MTSRMLPVTAPSRGHSLQGAHGSRPRTLGALKVAAS
jgi:hypothetical protein